MIATLSNGAGWILTEGQEGFVLSDPRDTETLMEKIKRASPAARALAERYSSETK